MHVDTELVERVLEEHAVTLVAVEQHEAEGIDVDLVGLGSEIVLAAQEIAAVGDHLLALGAEIGDGRSQFLQLHLADTIDVVGFDQQRLYAAVIRGRADRVGQIPE